MSFSYSDASVVTKLSHYEGALVLCDEGHQYRWVVRTQPAAMVIDPLKISPSTAIELLDGVVPPGIRCLCLDEFNYVRSPRPGVGPTIDA